MMAYARSVQTGEPPEFNSLSNYRIIELSHLVFFLAKRPLYPVKKSKFPLLRQVIVFFTAKLKPSGWVDYFLNFCIQIRLQKPYEQEQRITAKPGGHP
jgi:hypothetical protein